MLLRFITPQGHSVVSRKNNKKHTHTHTHTHIWSTSWYTDMISTALDNIEGIISLNFLLIAGLSPAILHSPNLAFAPSNLIVQEAVRSPVKEPTHMLESWVPVAWKLLEMMLITSRNISRYQCRRLSTIYGRISNTSYLFNHLLIQYTFMEHLQYTIL